MSAAEADRGSDWLFRLRGRPVLGYGFALLVVGAATGASFLLQEYLVGPAVLYFGAVVAAAFYAGLGPALAATALSVLSIEFAFLTPRMSLQLHQAQDLVILVTFAGIAVAVSWLTERLERSREELARRHRETETSSERQSLLAEATRLMGEAPSYREALQALAEHLCREISEYAITYTLTDHGTIRRVGVAHADPDRQPLVERLLELHRPTIEDRYGAGAVIRTGEAMLVKEIPEGLLERAAGSDTEYLELLRRLDPVSSVIVPLRARGHTIGALAVATTGRTGRRYDDDDLDLITELGYRVAVVLENLRLLEEARAAIRTRERIMAIVAHDLRNPLATVAYAAELLPEAASKGGADELAKVLERASRQALELLEDLIDVSRMKAGEYDVALRPTRVEELLEEARDAAELVGSRSGIQLTIELPASDAVVRADGKRLRRVFANLVENAFRFSPEGGEVRIGAQPNGEVVVFSVADEGPGIPEEDLPHVFEQFWHGEDSKGGTGLGLAIVRGIVHEHGGRTWAESAPDRGAKLCFTLPREESGTGA